MNTTEIAYLAWPWIGLGSSAILFILMFRTNMMRGNSSNSRWLDPVWLSWLTVPVYMLHVFEEYGLNVSDGMFDVVNQFRANGIDEMFGGIPLGFFPAINLIGIYIAFPLAAKLSKRNPVIGLMPYGFMFVNAMTHIVSGTVAMGQPLLSSPGDFTGLFCFVPMFAWFIYTCVKHRLLSLKGTIVAVISGILMHMGLFVVYIINLHLGSFAAAIWIPVMEFLGIVMAWLLCKWLKIQD